MVFISITMSLEIHENQLVKTLRQFLVSVHIFAAKYGLLEVFERGILTELCLYMSPDSHMKFGTFCSSKQLGFIQEGINASLARPTAS